MSWVITKRKLGTKSLWKNDQKRRIVLANLTTLKIYTSNKIEKNLVKFSLNPKKNYKKKKIFWKIEKKMVDLQCFPYWNYAFNYFCPENIS